MTRNQKFKNLFLVLLVLELLLAHINLAYAQTNTPIVYGGVEQSIKDYLCAPTDASKSAVTTTYFGTNISNNPTLQNNAAGNDLFNCINKLYRFAIAAGSVVSIMFIVIAGYLYMNSAGNQESVDKAKSIFESSIVSMVILFGGYILLRAINPDLLQFQPVNPPSIAVTPWVGPSIVPPSPSGTPPTGSTACNQRFSITPSSGCTVGTNCQNVSSLTPTHDCVSNNGTCLLSPSAAQRASTFISAYNQLGSSSGCTIKISSAIQVNGGPSASGCHHPGNSTTGNCADFNISPYNSACSTAFYKAAQTSGAVVSFLDEYVAACRTETTTGGNIHVNF